MTLDAERRLAYASGYNQALADLAETDDRILLLAKLVQRDHELEVAAMAAMEQHETIRQLEAMISTLASRPDSPNN